MSVGFTLSTVGSSPAGFGLGVLVPLCEFFSRLIAVSLGGGGISHKVTKAQRMRHAGDCARSVKSGVEVFGDGLRLRVLDFVS